MVYAGLDKMMSEAFKVLWEAARKARVTLGAAAFPVARRRIREERPLRG